MGIFIFLIFEVCIKWIPGECMGYIRAVVYRSHIKAVGYHQWLPGFRAEVYILLEFHHKNLKLLLEVKDAL